MSYDTKQATAFCFSPIDPYLFDFIFCKVILSVVLLTSPM